ASIDSDESYESGVEDSTNNVLEDMSSKFRRFDGKYGPYFPNFTSQTKEQFIEIEGQHSKTNKDRLEVETEILNNWNIKQNLAVSRLCTCWAIEAKVLKLAFSLSMTKNRYQELQELLESECETLLQDGP
ncbi:5243_t:CDS:2, partial [Dentiscutata erythropus]